MASSQLLPIFIIFTIVCLFSTSNSATCGSQSFYTKKVYIFCIDLSSMNSYLHWTYDSSRSILSIAFIAPLAHPDDWVSWGINQKGTGILGSQALFAFKDNAGNPTVKTYDLSSYSPLKESKVWYEVKESSADFSGGMVKLVAALILPVKNLKNLTYVSQEGSPVTNGVPDHVFLRENTMSQGTLYLSKGLTHTGDGDFSGTLKEFLFHGAYLISWGILIPLGTLIARYAKRFPRTRSNWYLLHFLVQWLAYIVGLFGSAIGFVIGKFSKDFTSHSKIETTLFVFATVQIIGLVWKHGRSRRRWRTCHRAFGYILLLVSIINGFMELQVLWPERAAVAYPITVGFIVCIAAYFEATVYWKNTMRVRLKNRQNSEDEEMQLLHLYREDVSGSSSSGWGPKSEDWVVAIRPDPLRRADAVELRMFSDRNMDNVITNAPRRAHHQRCATVSITLDGLLSRDQDDVITSTPERATHRRSETC